MTTPAARELNAIRRTALIAAGVFAAGYIAAMMATGLTVPMAVKVGVSLLALAAFVAFIVAELRLIRRLDELERRIQWEALAFAFPVSVGLLMALGLFERFMTLPAGDLSYRHLWPLMILAYFAGLVLARWRYQ